MYGTGGINALAWYFLLEGFVQPDLDITRPTKRACILIHGGELGDVVVGATLSQLGVDPRVLGGLALVSSELLASWNGVQELLGGIDVVLDLGSRDRLGGLGAPLEVGVPVVHFVPLTDQPDRTFMSLRPRHRHVSMHLQVPKEREVEATNVVLAVQGDR